MNLHFEDPGLTVAIAIAVGLSAQALARHLRIPGIVLLLAAGALLGPSGLALVHPEALGGGLEILVGYAVAVILFEGGLNLNLSRLRSQAHAIRRLVTEGALITAAGGSVLAHYLMGWSWPVAVVFGTLVTVTGPTVITPLLRRTRVKRQLHTILEAEGVFIDAIGALVAVVAFNAVFPQLVGGHALSDNAVLDLALRFGGGCLIGLVGGAVMVVLVRVDRLVPKGLENVYILSLVLVLFQISNQLLPESGIAAAAVAGVLVGNVRSRLTHELREFKEQLTVMMIGMLFVLLAADVGLEEVTALGLPGVLVVLGLMFLVRPLNVAISARGTDLDLADKAFLSWLAPRGIVAAAVSSLFAQEMTRNGIVEGSQLRALVFLVIAGTVLVQGLLASPMARILGVSRPRSGYAVLGANPLGLALGRTLNDLGEDVVLIDTDDVATAAAEAAGLRALWGNGIDEAILRRAELDGRVGAIGATTNQEANLLFALRARDGFRVPEIYVAVEKGHGNGKMEEVRDEGVRILYDGPSDLDRWMLQLRNPGDRRQLWQLAREVPEEGAGPLRIDETLRTALVPLIIERRDTVRPFHEGTRPRQGDRVWFVVDRDREREAVAWLGHNGWVAVPPRSDSARA